MEITRAMLILLLLLPISARANDVYDIRPMSERELMATYQNVMLDACRHAEVQWHEWSADPEGGYWGNAISDGNEGIRAISQMVLTCGALLKYSNALKGDERRKYMRKTTAAIYYCISTHVTGTQMCADGKRWGGSWQSAMWAGTLGFGAWLIWDDLSPDLRQGVERVMASETDRFLGSKPPFGRWNDTKAEENGWTLICISLAANMFPEHPHAQVWNEKAIEYMMSTLSTPADLRDTSIIDGKPVKEWVSGANLHPDFTLENHGFFHLSYVECSSYFLTQAAMHYIYVHRPVPQAATHHLMDTWAMLQTLLLPCGDSARPQGMDWELHGLPNINLMASLGTLMRDPTATDVEKIVLQRIRTWQEMQDGDLAVPGSKLGFTRHSIVAEQTSYGFLAHKLFGPSNPRRTGPLPTEGVRKHNSVGVVLHRTKSKLMSFSWKNRVMGMLAPIGEGHLGNPHFTVPILNGFVGSMETGGENKLDVVEHSWKETANGFETTGVLLTNGEQLRQTIKVCSIGERTVVYQDRVTAITDVTVTRELGIPFGIENDKLSGGKRSVYHQYGKTVFDWEKAQETMVIPGSWANVDGRLGIVTAAGSGLAYCQASGYNQQAVFADVLYGSFSDQPRSFKAGDEVASRIAVFFTEVSPEETAALAQSVHVEHTANGGVLRMRLPEGGETRLPLLGIPK